MNEKVRHELLIQLEARVFSRTRGCHLDLVGLKSVPKSKRQRLELWKEVDATWGRREMVFEVLKVVQTPP